ncbi:MAG: energy transducer TonB [Candidatus Krumholzibacteria bacterium]|nr:energy transducer TonB [Candidatus Krumholzibacteria bacterium]
MVTAQARLKEHYTRYLAEALGAAVMLHLAAALLVPPFEFEPYRPAFPFTTILVDDPLPPVVFDEPDIVKHPDIDRMPIIDKGEGTDDPYIPVNIPRTLDDFPVYTMPAQETPEFVAWDRAPVLLRAVVPAYPSLARQAGIEGTVMLRVVVGADGGVESASVIHSDVTPAMEQAAIAAALRFEWSPAMQSSIAVRSLMAVPVRFRLR